MRTLVRLTLTLWWLRVVLAAARLRHGGVALNFEPGPVADAIAFALLCAVIALGCVAFGGRP